MTHEDQMKLTYTWVMTELQKKCPCFKSALKAYVKWFLFSSEIMNGNRVEQETLLNHLQIEDTRLFYLIEGVIKKQLLDETGRIRSMQDRDKTVKLEIEDNLCYFMIGNDKIEIGVVKTDEEDKLTPYKGVFPIDLFIFAIQEEKRNCNFHIYDFNRLELYPYVVTIDKIEPDTHDLIESLKTQEITEDSATTIGGELYNNLIPEELSDKLKSKSDKSEQRVWIYCDDKEFDPIWEWLYTKEKDFFWGDRFYIVRIPESRKEGAAPLPFKIENIAILQGRLGRLIFDDSRCLDGICKAIPREKIGLEDCEKLKNLDDFDGIHVVASSDTFGKYFNKYIKSIKMALSSKREANLSNGNATKNRPAFLFLNICGCNKAIQSQIRELISADMWIDTSFEVTEDFASIFAKAFYEEFCTGKNAVEAVTKARQKIGNKNILRLVYVVRGNPYARV